MQSLRLKISSEFLRANPLPLCLKDDNEKSAPVPSDCLVVYHDQKLPDSNILNRWAQTDNVDPEKAIGTDKSELS
jgi:hypothetical protein